MKLLIFLLPVISAALFCSGPDERFEQDELLYSFDKGYGQVEVGGRFAGMEFHDSRPLPSRISFYYPVANSVDLSTGYWERAASRPMALGIRVDSGEALDRS